MQGTRPAQHGLRWTDNSSGELDPVWTVSPDITAIKQLAIQHLPGASRILMFASLPRELSINCTMSLYLPIPQAYLMRVSLPVEPLYKTESEVATIAYIRKHTTLPVPQVIAYDSSPENKLGVEWILMERIQGSCLYDVWEEIPYASKVDLTLHAADLIRQLNGLHFTQLGNLYYSTVKDRVGCKPHAVKVRATSGEKVDIDIGNEFVIGRMVSPWFFRDRRVWLPGDRGPFASSCELILAEADIQTERIKNLSPLPTDEYYSETDEELAEDQEAILETCNRLKGLIPAIFRVVESETNMLHHSDLSGGNILVDPATHRITGIVDWECVNIRPAWDVCSYPEFLTGVEVLEPPPLGTPGIDEDSLREIRKDWERVLLRRAYKKSMPDTISYNTSMQRTEETLSDGERNPILKRQFALNLAEMEMRWRAAKRWMDKLDMSR